MDNVEKSLNKNFDKLVHILKKHTRINIHKVKNTRKYNLDCIELDNKIKDMRKEEEEYFKKWLNQKGSNLFCNNK